MNQTIKTNFSRALSIVVMACLGLSLIGCTTYKLHTHSPKFYEEQRKCKQEMETGLGGGAAIGAGASLVAGRLISGSFNPLDLVGGAIIGATVAHFDNEAKVVNCLRQKGY